MPVVRVPLDDDLERAVADVERKHRIVSTQLAGDGCVLLFVEAKRKTPPRETR